jgi:hypothetical protein
LLFKGTALRVAYATASVIGVGKASTDADGIMQLL